MLRTNLHTAALLQFMLEFAGCRSSSRLPLQPAAALIQPILIRRARLNWQAWGGCTLLTIKGNTGDEQIWLDWLLGAAHTVCGVWRHPAVLSGVHITGVYARLDSLQEQLQAYACRSACR